MTRKLLTIDEFRSSAKEGPCSDATVLRVSVGEPKAYEDGSRKVRFCFSDGSIDRMGDTIQADGWETDNFLQNPVALFAHDSSQPPIGRAGNLAVEDGRLMGDIEFMPPEISGFADSIYRMVLAGYLRAVSVGFVPIEYTFVEDKDRPWGIDFKRQELLEISVVPVPANPNALVDAQGKGIDVKPLIEWAERTLDGGGKVVVPRKELEKLRRLAKAPGKRRRDPADGDGMSETDPAAAGALVATCGRSVDEECGLKNPAECEVHGPALADDAEKLLGDLVRFIEQLERSNKMAKVKGRVAPKRRAEENDDGNDAGADEMTHADHVTKAFGCFKAASSLYDSADEMHAKGLEHMQKAVDTLDGEARDNPEGEGEGDEGGEEKTALAKAKALLARHAKP